MRLCPVQCSRACSCAGQKGGDNKKKERERLSSLAEIESATDMTMTRLKHLVRYLMSCKDHVTILEPNGDQTDVDTWVDSDWAGDRVDRKSLDCIVVKVYDSVIHMSSKGQGAQAQSSAEAELGGIHRGALFAIGVQNFIHEVWGELLRICIWTDSSSGKVMSVRRGVGRTRHLEVWQCYIQAIVNSGRVKVRKCLGTKNDQLPGPSRQRTSACSSSWAGLAS